MDNEDGAKYISKKSDSIKNMFRSISGYYDFLNRLLSLGIDRSWRNKAAITLKDLEDKSLLDLACGTADLAIAIAEVHQSVKIVGIDFVDEMISIGKKKIEKLKLTDQIKLEVGDALNLKYDDDTFDAVTIGFGVRNFADLERGLGEIVRVTKPGGQILILEFSQPENKILKALYNFYFTKILPLIGGIIAKNQAAYKYLPDSVLTFAAPAHIKKILASLGCSNVEYKPLTVGIASIYYGIKNHS